MENLFYRYPLTAEEDLRARVETAFRIQERDNLRKLLRRVNAERARVGEDRLVIVIRGKVDPVSYGLHYAE